MAKPTQLGTLSRQVRATGAFTLTEIMMVCAIGTLILAGVMTTYTGCLKTFQAISNYVQIHQNGRNAVDVFARDMRAVSTVSSYTTSGSMVVVIPTSFTWNGTVTASKTITYSYSSNAWYRADSSTGETHLIADNVYAIVLTLFDRVGNPTTVLSVAKSVQVDIRLRKYVMNQMQSEDYVSARTIMRNKP